MKRLLDVLSILSTWLSVGLYLLLGQEYSLELLRAWNLLGSGLRWMYVAFCLSVTIVKFGEMLFAKPFSIFVRLMWIIIVYTIGVGIPYPLAVVVSFLEPTVQYIFVIFFLIFLIIEFIFSRIKKGYVA